MLRDVLRIRKGAKPKSIKAEASDNVAEFQRQADERSKFAVNGTGAMPYLPDSQEGQKPLTGAGINVLELINERTELGALEVLKGVIFDRYREESEAPRLTSEEISSYLGYAVIDLVRLMKSVDFNLTGNQTFSNEDINELIRIARRLAIETDSGGDEPTSSTSSSSKVTDIAEYRKK